MSTPIRRLPGFAIALLALALSASLAFAGQPAGSFRGLSTSPRHVSWSAPTTAGSDALDAGTDTDTQTDEADNGGDPSTDGSDPSGAAADPTSDTTDNCATDPTNLTPEELAALGHGSIVCWAAHQTSWDTTLYRNHGAFVSHWAHSGKGTDASTKTHGKSGH